MARRTRGKARAASAPTELESCVLGIVGQLGPCTAYSVRGFLGASQSSFWSASAGAIYPLLRRLTAAGWIESEELPFGSRQRTLYRLASPGRRALRRWLAAPVPEAALAHTFDPVRTRVFFLGLTSASAREAFLRDAVAGTAAVLDRHRTELNDGRDTFSEWEQLGREGAIRELEARLTWLRGVRRRVTRSRAGRKDPPPDGNR